MIGGYKGDGVNERVDNISPFIVMEIVREAGRFEDAIHFEVGQPDLPPSLKVKEALLKAIEDERYSYTESLGLEALREKIKDHYKKIYNVSIKKENILITPGTSGAFLVVYSLVCDYKNRLGFCDPGYPCYKNFSYLLDIEPVFIEVFKDSDYQITPSHLKNKKLKALQISNPANPTGNIYERDNLKDLIEYCEKRDIAFISDELYHGLVYDGEVSSALEFSENVFVINGFSKYFCMPGFRVGWAIIPDRFIKKAEEIAQNLFISAPTLSQFAALEAFDYEYLNKVRETFRKRRDFLYKELKDIFEIPSFPKGAFYLWADVSKYGYDSRKFSKMLLEKAHVAVTPGVDFGKNQTDKFIRFAYTTDIKKMREGVSRIREFIKNI